MTPDSASEYSDTEIRAVEGDSAPSTQSFEETLSQEPRTPGRDSEDEIEIRTPEITPTPIAGSRVPPEFSLEEIVPIPHLPNPAPRHRVANRPTDRVLPIPQSAAIRIEDQSLRAQRTSTTRAVKCTVCKIQTSNNTWTYRSFVNLSQLRIHQGGKSHLKELRKQNKVLNSYFCQICNLSFRGPSAKNNFDTHKLGKRHRRAVHDSKFKKYRF